MEPACAVSRAFPRPAVQHVPAVTLTGGGSRVSAFSLPGGGPARDSAMSILSLVTRSLPALTPSPRAHRYTSRCGHSHSRPMRVGAFDTCSLTHTHHSTELIRLNNKKCCTCWSS